MAANVNNYVKAGNTAVRKAVIARKALADNKPRYDEMAIEAVNQEAKNRANAAKNNSTIAQTRMNAEAAVEKTGIKTDADKYVKGQQRKARMTGLLAGGAAMLGYAAMQGKEEDEGAEVRELMKAQTEYYRSKANSANAEGNAPLERPQMPVFETPDGTTPSSSNTPSDSTGGGNTQPSSQSSGSTLSQSDIYARIVAKGRSPEFAKTFSAIAMAESGGRSAIDTVQSGTDPDKSNEYSIGTFQVNTQAHMDKLTKRGWTVEDLRDPDKNLDIALEIYDEVGSFKPWGAFTNNSYSKFLK